ncbi:MAG: hypothetical protein ABIU63_00975 [Chitinophagaceae bacterium]
MISWYATLTLACLLLLFLFYREWKRPNRSRLYARLLASLLAAGSLVWMAYPGANKHTAVRKLVILTEGFVRDSIENFLQKNNSAIPLFSAAGKYTVNGYTTQPVADWHAFALAHVADTLHVFGNGFNNTMLDALYPHPIVFHGSPASPAITDVYWKQNIDAGEPLRIQGNYNNNSSQKIKLVLQAFGSGKDSVVIEPGTHQPFSLQCIPVHSGRALYALRTIAGNDTLHREPVPVVVQKNMPLQLLIISSSPDFDNTYLKNHFSQQGFRVFITNTITARKTAREFINMPAQPAGTALTTTYLDKFDVLLADEEALQKISAAELAAVRSTVQDKGMGLLIKMDNQKKSAAFYTPFFTVKALPQNKPTFVLLQGNTTDSSAYKIKLSDPAAIGYVSGTQVILKDAQSNIFASAVAFGNGKIIATTLQNTFSMALAGNTTAYQQLWWLLLNKVAKKQYPEEVWRTSSFFASVNNPALLEAETNAAPAQTAMAGRTTIYLEEGSLPYSRTGTYWPGEMGWQDYPDIQKAGGNWYVYQASDWQQLLWYQRAAATRAYVERRPLVSGGGETTGISKSVYLRLYLLLVFFSCVFFLWAEQKLG